MNSSTSRKTLWLSLLLGLSLLVNTGFVGGFIYHRHFMLPPEERMQNIQQNLQLSATQRAALQHLQQEVRNEARDNLQTMRARHHELVEQLRQEPLNLPALEKYLRATTEPQVAMQRDVILRLLTFRDTLNPGQKKVFNEKMERPGFMLHLAGFPGPLWRPSHCRGKDDHNEDHDEDRRGDQNLSPPDIAGPPPPQS